jgi:hypothetical protein
VDRTDWKSYILPLMFFKRICDVWDEEKEVPPAEDEDRGKTALTELFQQSRNADTPIMVERIVDDIDDNPLPRLAIHRGWEAGSKESIAQNAGEI